MRFTSPLCFANPGIFLSLLKAVSREQSLFFQSLAWAVGHCFVVLACWSSPISSFRSPPLLRKLSVWGVCHCRSEFWPSLEHPFPGGGVSGSGGERRQVCVSRSSPPLPSLFALA